MIGQKLSPVLQEIEFDILEHEARTRDGNGVHPKPDYTQEGFRAAIKIFISALMDKIWELQSKEDMAFEDKCNMAQKCGEDIRQLVKVYTDIDTHDLY